MFNGRELEINGDAGSGAIAVEIQDPSGLPLPGYTLGDCEALRRDQVHHVVQWNGNSDLTLMAGRPVKLRFQLRNARLYAFQFVGWGPSRDPVAVVSEQPWQTADLDRPIQVGTEVATEEDGARVALSGANQSCSRCQLIIGEFEAVRIFARPQGRKGELYFHEKCGGNLRVADA